MLTVLVTLIMIFLSFHVLPLAIGINIKSHPLKSLLTFILIVSIQVFIYWLGIWAGNMFMYLMDGFSGVIIFIGFLLIGIRMLMEVFNIRKGERSYSHEKFWHIALASLAQGINSFLVGLMFYYIPTINVRYTLIVLLIAVSVISLIGLFMKSQKLNLVFASLLYAIGGIGMLFSGCFLAFYY
ncbi:MAG: hypothetical protein HN336_05575 [Lentimicrobiaceae bacterium]|jgi:hypothetical protein|nr:hypothetical protein [Lentimicrobiaceae bacterium]MCP4911340.1 hypothetical protein [Bacteroidota bacterium]MBT3454070.1 hypothetical protein [Lentimicrobiaceae bacterium]MBT3819188.1 hypothetical protein [Lentimicrobiaceae bacterium]MBT4060617.1 hypothetical protein [Lentimicrobiaceae bacterium]